MSASLFRYFDAGIPMLDLPLLVSIRPHPDLQCPVVGFGKSTPITGKNRGEDSISNPSGQVLMFSLPHLARADKTLTVAIDFELWPVNAVVVPGGVHLGSRFPPCGQSVVAVELVEIRGVLEFDVPDAAVISLADF